MKNLLWYLVAGTRGGESRARIIDSIRKKPSNIHQLSKRLGMDYKTAQYHVNMLEENNILSAVKKGSYGAVYFLSAEMEKNIDDFEEIWKRFGDK